MTYRLGKTPARLGAFKLSLAKYIDYSQLPVPPAEFGQDIPAPDWQVLGNDKYGNCVWAGAGHESMLWNRGAGKVVKFTDASVLSDYSAVTGFDPMDPSTDQGTDMQVAAAYRKKTGIVDSVGQRHFVAAYLGIEAGNIQEHLVAAYIFGCVGVGIEFPDSAMEQFNSGGPWNPIPGASIVGGHYIPLVARKGGMSVVVTWGKEQMVTDSFLQVYGDESVVYLSSEFLQGGKTPRGFDLERLNADLAALQGQPKVSIPVTKTTPDLTAAEIAVATEAAKALIAAKVPFWEKAAITDAVLQEFITTVVTAVDNLRDKTNA
jgi:hypothetical protein